MSEAAETLDGVPIRPAAHSIGTPIGISYRGLWRCASVAQAGHRIAIHGSAFTTKIIEKEVAELGKAVSTHR